MAHAPEAPATIQAEGPTQHTPNQADRPANTYGYTRAEQVEALHRLREPFAPTEIRYLPRVWCRACKSAGWNGCQQHPAGKCGKCKQKMPNGGHIDLAYVGHAEATNRLLNVDPFWDWEPLTVDERGLPQVDGYRGLWIRLTVCGMSRLGYGHAGDKTGGDAVKEVIGDAIRNAGMRFGMALDLWTTSELEIIESGGASLDDTGEESGGQGSVPASRPAAAVKSSKPQSARAAAAPEPQEDAPAAELVRLMGQVQRCWANPVALGQTLLAGKKAGVDGQRVQGPDGAWTTFDALVSGRINELKGAAQGGDTERSAA